jgi:polysaccharide export outer membrane protein
MTISRARFISLVVAAAFAAPLAAAGASAQAPFGTRRPSASQATPAKPEQKPPAATATQKPASGTPAGPTVKPAATPAPPAVPPPPGYLIGADDVLQVLFRYDRDLTTEVVVRPDGMISLPMLSDVQAAGLTPEQLRDNVTESAKRFIEDPAVTVIVKQINSRKVFITGQVQKPGPYPLTAPTTVMQLIAIAGGLSEFADEKGITVMRTENGKPVSFAFNYKEVARRRNLKQNIELKPGDTVIVP